MQGLRDGKVPELKEHDSHHQENEDDIHPGDEVRVDEIVAFRLLPGWGMNEASIRLPVSCPKPRVTGNMIG